jgi:hypothetical protein
MSHFSATSNPAVTSDLSEKGFVYKIKEDVVEVIDTLYSDDGESPVFVNNKQVGVNFVAANNVAYFSPWDHCYLYNVDDFGGWDFFVELLASYYTS